MKNLTKREKVLGLVLAAVLLMGAGQAVNVAATQTGKVTVYNLTAFYPDAGANCTTISAAISDRKNVTLQNLGPNPVFCGFTTSSTPTITSWAIGAGQTWPVDYGSAIPICCGATVADQVSPFNLREIEAN